MPSYYKIIKGVRYDRKLIELAQELTEGMGDGSLSLKDMKRLHEATLDGRGTTTVELWTLDYILTAFKVTEKAAEWLKNQIDLVQPGSVPAIINRIVRDKYNLSGLKVLVKAKDVKEQSALPNNKISFEQAIDKAIVSFLSDFSHPESPGSIVSNVFELYPPKVKNAAVEVNFKLGALLKNAELILLPNLVWNEEEDYDFNPPEERESASKNWIFSLYIEELSDHIYWAIVPRDGKKGPYNYGFN